ncbi:putative basic proline-rich protein-like [Iris pallida]|uniref:Basic proline-rich protein-like n=1 Tax=Iris pallida TaxID=29817 RepID=A0AAX6H4L0_IRIPA|nr:putative basic proline-rich protein-like [Iris pallida]
MKMKKQVGAGAPLLATPPPPPPGGRLVRLAGRPPRLGWPPHPPPPHRWLSPLHPFPLLASHRLAPSTLAPPSFRRPPPAVRGFLFGERPPPFPPSPHPRDVVPVTPRRRRARRWPPLAPATRPGVLGPLPESSPARSPPSGPSPPRPDPLSPRSVAAPSSPVAPPASVTAFSLQWPTPAASSLRPPGCSGSPDPPPFLRPRARWRPPSSSTTAWVHSLELGTVASPQPPSGRVSTSGRAVPPSPAVAALSLHRDARSGSSVPFAAPVPPPFPHLLPLVPPAVAGLAPPPAIPPSPWPRTSPFDVPGFPQPPPAGRALPLLVSLRRLPGASPLLPLVWSSLTLSPGGGPSLSRRLSPRQWLLSPVGGPSSGLSPTASPAHHDFRRQARARSPEQWQPPPRPVQPLPPSPFSSRRQTATPAPTCPPPRPPPQRLPHPVGRLVQAALPREARGASCNPPPSSSALPLRAARPPCSACTPGSAPIWQPA